MSLQGFSSEELEQELKRRGALSYAERLAKYGGLDPEEVLEDKNRTRVAIDCAERVIKMQVEDIAEKKGGLDRAYNDALEELHWLNQAHEALNAWQQNRWEFR